MTNYFTDYEDVKTTGCTKTPTRLIERKKAKRKVNKLKSIEDRKAKSKIMDVTKPHLRKFATVKHIESRASSKPILGTQFKNEIRQTKHD